MSLLTRTAKGSALTHQEMDENLELLDRQGYLMTEAEFEALAAARRDEFSGSGLIGYPLVSDTEAAGDYIFANVSLGSNTFRIKAQSYSIYGIKVYTADRDITLPDAPATEAYAERQDLVFLRTRRVNVSIGGTVYERGDIAEGGQTWSTKAAEQKKIFASDPQNNLYFGSDENVYQLQWSFVVVADSSAMDAAGYAQGQDDAGLWFDGTYQAIPVALISRRNKGAYHPIFNPFGSCEVLSESETVTPKWYETGAKRPQSTWDCFDFDNAIPTPYNGYISSAVSGRPDGKYYDAVYADDIFDLRNCAAKPQDLNRLLDREFNKLISGEVRGWEAGSTLSNSGHTENYYRYADGIVRIYNLSDRDYFKNDAVILFDSTRGEYAVLKCHQYYAANTYEKDFSPVVSTLTLSDASSTAGDDTVYHGFGSQLIQYETLLQCDIIGDPANYYRGHYDFLDTEGSQTINDGDVVKLVNATISGVIGNFYKRIGGSITQDLDSFNYANTSTWENLGTDREDSWITNGIAGTPLLVGENGENLIPDGTSKSWKASRKVHGASLLCLTSSDNGNTWTTYSNFTPGAANLIAGPGVLATGALRLIFYQTKASQFEAASNAETLTTRKAISLSHNTQANLVANLIGKIPTGTTGYAAQFNVDGYGLNADGLLLEAAAFAPTHNTATDHLDTDSPACKVWPLLTKENGRLCLQLLFKELIYDTDWGDDSKLNVIDGVSTTTDGNGNTVMIGLKRIELPYFIANYE